MKIRNTITAALISAALAVGMSVAAAAQATAQRINDPCIPEVIVEGDVCR